MKKHLAAAAVILGISTLVGIVPPIIVGTLTLTSCASSTARAPIEEAKLIFAQTSIAYEAGMLTAQDLRRAHQLNDAQWSRVDQAQKIAQTYSSVVRSMLSVWQVGGSKPGDYDAAIRKLLNAVAEISATNHEVKP